MSRPGDSQMHDAMGIGCCRILAPNTLGCESHHDLPHIRTTLAIKRYRHDNQKNTGGLRYEFCLPVESSNGRSGPGYVVEGTSAW